MQKHIALNPLEYNLTQVEKNTNGEYNRNSFVSYLGEAAIKNLKNFNFNLIRYFINLNLYNKTYLTIIKDQNITVFYTFMEECKYVITLKNILSIIETDNVDLFKITLQLVDMTNFISNVKLLISKAHTSGSLKLLRELLTITKYEITISDIRDAIPCKKNVSAIEYLSRNMEFYRKEL